MTRLEKLKMLDKAYTALIPCIANNAVGNLGLILNDAPRILRELIDEEAANAIADAIAKERETKPEEPRSAHIHTVTITISVDTAIPFDADGGTQITFSADPEPQGEYKSGDYPACAFAQALVQSVKVLNENTKEE